jgi:NADH:ubiquinone oxidoreductase subunit E
MKDNCKCGNAVPETVNQETITEILGRHDNRVDALIMILQDIQNVYRFLPEEALRIVTEKLEIPFSQVYEVATFYRSFSLVPKGEHEIKVCLGTACHLKGGPLILENFERELEVASGGTTNDKSFTLETVNCVGACALAPLVVVDNEYFGNNNSSSVKKILKKYSDK